MKTSLILTAMLASLTTIGVAQARDQLYEHKHTGSMETQKNTDVDFGNPGDIRATDRTVEFTLTSSGTTSHSSLGVSTRENVRFDLKNDASQTAAFVIGDAHAIKEFAELFKADPNNVAQDFHGVILAPGQTQKFAWKFNTFATPMVYAAYVTRDGNYTKSMMKIYVSPETDRNQRR